MAPRRMWLARFSDAIGFTKLVRDPKWVAALLLALLSGAGFIANSVELGDTKREVRKATVVFADSTKVILARLDSLEAELDHVYDELKNARFRVVRLSEADADALEEARGERGPNVFSRIGGAVASLWPFKSKEAG